MGMDTNTFILLKFFFFGKEILGVESSPCQKTGKVAFTLYVPCLLLPCHLLKAWLQMFILTNLIYEETGFSGN